MRYLLLLLIPTIALAQTPTPTPDPEETLAAEYNISVLEIRLGKLQHQINQIRNMKKVERRDRLGNSAITLTAGQKAELRTRRRNSITALQSFCDGVSNLPVGRQ